MAAIDILIPSRIDLAQQTRVSLLETIRATQCRCGTHAPWDCNKGKHDLVWMPPISSSSIIHWARNQMLAMGMYGPHPEGRPQPEYFLLMDDDMLIEPHYIERLAMHKKDIVAGICTVRRDPPSPTIRLWLPEIGQYKEPFEWDWNSVKLMEIDASGTAFMLVKRKVLERMGEAYLDCFFERRWDKERGYDSEKVDFYWDNESIKRRTRFDSAEIWQHKDCWWFQMLPATNIDARGHGELGEDISFCWKAKQLGFRVFADPQVTPGHIGAYGFSIADYQYYVEQMKAEGKAPMIPPINQPKDAMEVASGAPS